MSKPIDRCSCSEVEHLRHALRAIVRLATTDTRQGACDDLAQIANLADQGLKLEPLTGDPGVYRVASHIRATATP